MAPATSPLTAFAINAPLAISVLLGIAMTGVVMKFFSESRQLDKDAIASTCRYRQIQLKYIAVLAASVGLLGSLYMAERILYHLAVAGLGWDNTLGPLSEAIVPLEYGLTTFGFGLVCTLIITDRARRLSNDK